MLKTMKIFLDTNILISAMVWPNSNPSNDRPLLRAAIKYGADIFLTGDKDFLESGVQNPKIMSVSDFLELE